VTRTPSKRRLSAVIGVVVLAALTTALVAGCGDDGEANVADLPAGVVARVGDAPITEAQLDHSIGQSTAEARESGQTIPTEGEQGYDTVRQQVLQGLVVRKIVDFEARKCGQPCRVTPAQIDERVDQLIKDSFKGSRKEFDQYRAKRKITDADVNAIVKQELQQQRLFAWATRSQRYTAAQAAAYYRENRAQFKIPEQRTASHILVKTEAEARQIRAEVTPENFATIAKEKSIDPGSGKNGGDLGDIQRGRFVAPFEKAAFAMKQGEISQPVKSAFGWHIIYVTKVVPAHTKTFAEAKPEIIRAQLEQKRQSVWNDWSQETLRAWSARTVYADANLTPPDQTNQAPAESVPSG
jgi:parvulin-like peptidyl-prolyl isomerase